MQSQYWKDSAFILTYDENGGLYDHVSPQPAVSPDGIKPVDLLPGDICTTTSGPTCDFVYTGYRVPLIVISPYAKQELCVAHRSRYDGNPQADRDALQGACINGSRRRAAGYDGVFQFHFATMDDSSDSACANHERSVLREPVAINDG